MKRLLTIHEAAEILGVPPGSLQTAARANHELVHMGRATRIDSRRLDKLIDMCREPREQPRPSLGAALRPTRGARDPGDDTRRAMETAEKLKRLNTERVAGRIHG